MINESEMTIEDLQNKINDNNQEMILLQEKIDKTKQDKVIGFENVMDLISEITNAKKIYYEYRSILGNAILLGLTENEFNSIEAMMPIYKRKIDLLENRLENIDVVIPTCLSS